MPLDSLTQRDLPTGPDTVFRRAEPVLSDAFGEGAYALGSGTGLAAVWKHRHSTDVDLFMDSGAYRRLSLNDERRNALDAALRKALSAEVVQVARGFLKVAAPDGELSLITAASDLAPLVPTDRVSGTAVPIERPAVILGRKLHGRMLGNGDFTIRDLYDIAAAAELAPDELALALDSLEQSEKAALRGELGSLPPGWADDPMLSGRAVLAAAAPEPLAQEPSSAVRIVRDLFGETRNPMFRFRSGGPGVGPMETR